MNYLFCISSSLACNRGGQGGGASDRHWVQPISESAELLHRRVPPPPSPYPEFRAFDWHVRHPPRHEWVCFSFPINATHFDLLLNCNSTYVHFSREDDETVSGLLENQYMDTQSLYYQAVLWSPWPLSDPVSRKSIKSAHSSRNRYSSQWTLSRPSQSQSTASARTLTSDWRTMGSHGITATESDSYSASLSQDTGGSIPASTTDTITPLLSCSTTAFMSFPFLTLRSSSFRKIMRSPCFFRQIQAQSRGTWTVHRPKHASSNHKIKEIILNSQQLSLKQPLKLFVNHSLKHFKFNISHLKVNQTTWKPMWGN